MISAWPASSTQPRPSWPSHVLAPFGRFAATTTSIPGRGGEKPLDAGRPALTGPSRRETVGRLASPDGHIETSGDSLPTRLHLHSQALREVSAESSAHPCRVGPCLPWFPG